MKPRLFLLTLSVFLLLFTACSGQTMEQTADRVEETLEAPIDAVEDQLDPETAPAPSTTDLPPEGDNAAAAETPAEPTTEPPAETVTQEKAESIALEHAGFSADEVTQLHTEYEIDDGIPHYEVKFYHENWEYDYEIHAETGAILSFDKDD